MRVAFDRDHALEVLEAIQEGQSIPAPAGHWQTDDLLCVAGALIYEARKRLLETSIRVRPTDIFENREFAAGVYGVVKCTADLTLAIVNDSYDRQFERRVVGWIEAPIEEPQAVPHFTKGVRPTPIKRKKRRR